VTILLGTKNPHKIREITEILSELLSGFQFVTFRECPFSDVPEEGATLEENALLKARTICAQTGMPVLAEDSGLEVEALGGAPGVRSARLAGRARTIARTSRSSWGCWRESRSGVALFGAWRCLSGLPGEELLSEGILWGQIARAPRGTGGFGYDPIFIPEGYDQTLAELGLQIKNRISHRRRALEALMRHLRLSPLAEHLRR
jgi:XTP/dITP diphosphohydrolase